MTIKRLNTGDAAIGTANDILFTGGIGSCVVICLWDSVLKVGGMAHMPLPHSTDSFIKGAFSFGVAPDIAFPYLLQKMKYRGSKHEDLTVRLIGGGNMFSEIKSIFLNDVGKAIVEKTTEQSIALNVPILKGCTGGKFGKSVSFTIETGGILVQHTNGFSENI